MAFIDKNDNDDKNNNNKTDRRGR